MITLESIGVRLLGGVWFCERDGETQEIRDLAQKHLERPSYQRFWRVTLAVFLPLYIYGTLLRGFNLTSLVLVVAIIMAWRSIPGIPQSSPGVVRLLLNSLAHKRRTLVLQALGPAMKGVTQRDDLSAEQWEMVRQLLRSERSSTLRAGLLEALAHAGDPRTLELIRDVYGGQAILNPRLSHAEIEALSLAKLKLSEPHSISVEVGEP